MASKLTYAVLLILPAVYADIAINAVVSNNDTERKVDYSRDNVDIISENEKNTFQLSDDNLDDAVLSYFGKRSDNAYLKRLSNPRGDLYKTFWLSPQKATILDNFRSPTKIITQKYKNNNNTTANINVYISQPIQNTFSSTWTKDGELTVCQEINYSFHFKFIKKLENNEVSYSSKWGENVNMSQTAYITYYGEITLEPYQNVTAELYVIIETIKVQVDYEAVLSGDTAVNYNETYKHRQFWGLDINGVMCVGGLPRSTHSSEVIEMNFYSGAYLVFKCDATKKILYRIPLKV